VINHDPDRLLDDSGALPAARPPWSPRDDLRVRSVRAIVTAPEGLPLVVVPVETSDDGLFGLGCATFTQRYEAVVAALRDHVAPLVIGRHPADVEDITRLVHLSSYWRHGPVLNNALSASTRHCGTSRASARACPCTNCSAVAPARPRTSGRRWTGPSG
jgi:mannonate dehydratase